MFLFERQCYRKRTGSEREREKEREGGRHTERASTPRSFFKRPQQLHVGKTEARSQLPLLFLRAQGPQPFSRLHCLRRHVSSELEGVWSRHSATSCPTVLALGILNLGAISSFWTVFIGSYLRNCSLAQGLNIFLSYLFFFCKFHCLCYLAQVHDPF